MGSTGSEGNPVERKTVDDEPCLLPSTWNGQTVNDCIITQAGGQPVCQVRAKEANSSAADLLTINALGHFKASLAHAE